MLAQGVVHGFQGASRGDDVIHDDEPVNQGRRDGGCFLPRKRVLSPCHPLTAGETGEGTTRIGSNAEGINGHAGAV